MTDRDETERCVAVLGQHLRVKVRPGTGVPLVLCNGIGTSLDVLDPLVAQLDPDTTVVRFDAPGTGGSPDSVLPYGFPYLATVLGRLLRRIELSGPIDVLGFSWGGALAQQFAFQNPRRCRRLILTFTATGAIMVPARPSLLATMASRRRFLGHNYGAASQRPPSAGTRKGYSHQLLAGAMWTSVFALPLVRQETLIIAGTEDPIVPVANARIMAGLLPHATVHLHPGGGHMDLITDAAELAPVIEEFRRGNT